MEAVSASSGGIAATVSLFPLDTIKTRMQARKASGSSDGGGVADTVLGIMEDGGPMAFFAGVTPGAVQSAIEKFVYFYAYTIFKAAWKDATGEATGTISNLAIGYISEWCHLPITLPLERVVKTIQTTRKDQQKAGAAAEGSAGDRGNGSAGAPRASSPGVLATVETIRREQGFAGFYRGVVAYIVLCLRPAIQYTIFERLRQVLLRRQKGRGALSAAEAFVLGAIARAVATLVVYPYIRAKVMAQAAAKAAPKKKHPSPPSPTDAPAAPGSRAGAATPGAAGSATAARGTAQGAGANATNSDDTARPPTMTESINAVWQSEGIAGVYRGIKPELFRGMLSAAVMLMVKERIYVVNRRIFMPRVTH